MGNLTHKHIEDVSMCALFLMEAAKTNREFQCHQSSAHTVQEAEKDINKLAEHLLDKTVTIHSPDRNTPAFKDPTNTGYKKLCNTSWVQEILSKTGREECDLDVEMKIRQMTTWIILTWTILTWTMKLQTLFDLTLNQDLLCTSTLELHYTHNYVSKCIINEHVHVQT